LALARDCNICQGTGFRLTTDEQGVVHSTPCDCDRERHADLLLRATRIPRRYEHCTFEHWETHDASHGDALRACQEWVTAFPAVDCGLALLGPPGRGKTHLAVAVGRELVRLKGTRVLFWEQRALLKSLQGTFDSASDQRESEILGPVIEAELLILDDVGAGRTTPWARDVLHDVITQRYNDKRPLVLTSNLRLDEDESARPSGKRLEAPLTLRDRLGDALFSRLHEMCRVLPVGGEDYRSGILDQKYRY